MPACIPNFLKKLQFNKQPIPTHSPLPCAPPSHAKTQCTSKKEKTKLPPKQITYIQKPKIINVLCSSGHNTKQLDGAGQFQPSTLEMHFQLLHNRKYVLLKCCSSN